MAQQKHFAMESEKYTEKLAKYTLYAGVFCLIAALCWYLKDVLVYILTAVVISLMARPITTVLRKIKIRGKRMPDWLSALIALLLLIGGILAIATMIIPIIGSIAKGISMASIEKAAAQVSVPLANLNEFLRTSFPALGQDFKIETSIFNELHNLLDVSIFSSVLGSAASIISSVGVGLFSVVFISFFFTKDESLFGKMIGSLVPDRHEENATAAISDIGQLLSRYFSGVVVEMIGVGLLNFLGLFFITRLGFNAAIGIAFLTGILNIIPYVGPLFGGILGTMLAIIVKYSSVTPIGLNIGFGWFVLILIAIFCFTQLVDNILYQPIIYSSSIKAKPLEIFIVLLIAGHLAGPLGMIIAIPGYTVIRVIAFRFFPDIKAIKRLEKQ
jgi:predicted PurR-regulated permease PerM